MCLCCLYCCLQGVFNRVNGAVVAITELVVFALPFSVVQYVPNFYFGALLVWFGIEISRDWLVLSYRCAVGLGLSSCAGVSTMYAPPVCTRK